MADVVVYIDDDGKSMTARPVRGKALNRRNFRISLCCPL
jgi:hypothetical protein